MCLKMAISLAALKITFMALGTLMVATLIYTLSIDGLPFRIDLLTPSFSLTFSPYLYMLTFLQFSIILLIDYMEIARWMKTTLLDFYINVTVLAIWVIYKESSWIAAVLWVILLVCLGSITTCTYIVVQLFKFSAEESTHDPMHYLLLHHQDNRKDASRSFCQLVTAKIFFIALGCLMLGTLLYTIIVYGSPFNKEVLTPWMVATLIDFYINVSALSVWVSYKESSWFTAVIWIVLLICFGSIATCAYVASQFFSLSPHDPMYLVLLNKRQRAESRYETTSGSG